MIEEQTIYILYFLMFSYVLYKLELITNYRIIVSIYF